MCILISPYTCLIIIQMLTWMPPLQLIRNLEFIKPQHMHEGYGSCCVSVYLSMCTRLAAIYLVYMSKVWFYTVSCRVLEICTMWTSLKTFRLEGMVLFGYHNDRQLALSRQKHTNGSWHDIIWTASWKWWLYTLKQLSLTVFSKKLSRLESKLGFFLLTRWLRHHHMVCQIVNVVWHGLRSAILYIQCTVHILVFTPVHAGLTLTLWLHAIYHPANSNVRT